MKIGNFTSISPEAKIGKNVVIGNFCIIEDGVTVDDGVVIGDYCKLSDKVKIGENTIIKNYVEVRSDTEIGKFCYIDSYVVFSGKCTIGNEVTLRYGVIIARGVFIGDNSYLSPRVMTNNIDKDKHSIGGARIGFNCFIGTHTVINHGLEIGNDVIIGANSYVNKNCKSNTTYFGIPAREKNK